MAFVFPFMKCIIWIGKSFKFAILNISIVKMKKPWKISEKRSIVTKFYDKNPRKWQSKKVSIIQNAQIVTCKGCKKKPKVETTIA